MRSLKLFFKSFLITLFCLVFVTIIYLGFCKTYEAMRNHLFEDTKNAVEIGENYIKFFFNQILKNNSHRFQKVTICYRLMIPCFPCSVNPQFRRKVARLPGFLCFFQKYPASLLCYYCTGDQKNGNEIVNFWLRFGIF